VTWAVNCIIAPVVEAAVRGEMNTVTTGGGGGADTVTVAVSFFEVSATLVASTW
jgi:hypothetical protein